MKTVINMFRLFLLFSVFTASYINAKAYSIDVVSDNFGNTDMLVLQHSTDNGNQSFALNITDKGMIPLAPTITLTVTPLNARIARLSWTVSEPVFEGTYYVERQVTGSGAWEDIKQLPFDASLLFNDTITAPYCIPTDFLYRIRYESALSGIIFSNTDAGNQLSDLTNPVNVQDLLVSLTTGGKPILTWTQVLGDSIGGYEINRFDGTTWQPITSPPLSPDSSSYIDQAVSDGCTVSYAYLIITLDGCGNRSVPDYTFQTQTINLDLPPIDECERLAKLSWNSYYTMPGGLGGYKIYRSVDFSAPVEIVNLTDTSVTAYNDAYQFEDGHNYYYYVEAYSSSGSFSSRSCWKMKLFTGSEVPDSVYITQVSVLSDSYIRINYYSSPDSTVKILMLERSADQGATFQVVDSLYADTYFVAREYYFDDYTADVHNQSYYYRLVALDYCGNGLNSNISRSILLQCSSTQTQNTVDWNTYASWMQDVEGYKLFRTVGGEPGGGELIGSLTSSIVSFPDLLTGIDPTKEVCYWVVAQENPGNPYLNNAESVSNTCCVAQDATLFLPNAFHPGGINNRFRPIASFVEPGSFIMTIYNRWGQMLFETTDMVNGWDGMVGGQIAPAGLYAFVISYKSVGGHDYTKRGTVFVVR